MQEQQKYRGFVISITAQNERAGGSKITLMMERPEKAGGTPKPQHCHSSLTGVEAINEAMNRARSAIEKALGPRNPFGD